MPPDQAARPPFKVISSRRLIILAALYFLTVLNLNFWKFMFQTVELTSSGDFLFAVSLPLFLFGGLTAAFSLLVWPYLAKPALIGLTLLSSATGYAMLNYGIHIDIFMIRNVFETTWREATDLVTPGWLAFVGVFGLLPSMWLARVKIEYQPGGRELRSRLILTGLALAAVVGLVALNYEHYSSFRRQHRYVTRFINPSNIIYGTVKYAKQLVLTQRNFVLIDDQVGRLAAPDPEPTVFILIAGETARAMNFSLNGYPRPTNPRLTGRDIISFGDVTAAGTSTNVALPSMFSDLPRARVDIEAAGFRENLLNLLEKAGYGVLWRENDEGCKNICDRVPTENMTSLNNPRFCDGRYCYDQVLIDDLEEYLRTVTKDTFIVLHTMGSHGPTYYLRYTDEFRAFEPTCDTSDIRSCSSEALVNTYDNTIVYTDHIISETIDILKKFPGYKTGLLYVSDHGESLGENGIYLHAAPYDRAPAEQLKVPMILWLSEMMQVQDGIDYDCLKESRDRPLSHDHLFHSILGLMNVSSHTYQPELDLFRPCRPPEFQEPPSSNVAT